MDCTDNRQRFLIVLLACIVLMGCNSSSDDKLTPVAGRVIFDVAPVESGTIEFMHADGVTPPTIAVIADGNFETRLLAGTMKVVISSRVKVGERAEFRGAPDSPVYEIVKEAIADRYSTQSKLTLEVGEIPIKELQYDLKGR